jgi:hypothetical protein
VIRYDTSRIDKEAIMATHTITRPVGPTAVPVRTAPSQPARLDRAARLGAELKQDLPWLLLTVGTAVGAAAATSAWMIHTIHLF